VARLAPRRRHSGRSEHCKAERSCGAGHTGVVRDDGTELVPELECGGEMQSVERSQRDGFESGRRGANPVSEFDDGDLCDDGMRLQRTRLRFLDDELDERRGVDVYQSRSSRRS
jgi:hypothetical protein